MRNSSSLINEHDEQAVLNIFTAHPDPPWQDFTRSTHLDGLQSSLIMELQKLESSPSNNSKPNHVFGILSNTKSSNEVLSSTTSVGLKNVEIYWSTRIPYLYPIPGRESGGNTIFFAFELYSNSHSKKPPAMTEKGKSDAHVVNTQPHIIQRVFAVNTFLCLSLQGQADDENQPYNIPLPDEIAPQLISSVSCAVHELGYDVPCFIQIDKQESRYLGIYHRIGGLPNTDYQPFLIQYFSYTYESNDTLSAIDLSDFSMSQMDNTSSNVSQMYTINQYLTWTYGTITNPFEATKWPRRHPINLLKDQTYIIPGLDISQLHCNNFYIFPNNLLTISITQERSTFPNNEIRGLHIWCQFKPWKSPSSNLFENLLNLRFEIDKNHQAKVQPLINFLNKRSYEHHLVKRIFKKKKNKFDVILEGRSDLFSNELKYAREGLLGAPFGSILSMLAFVGSTLQEKSFIRLWNRSLTKMRRRWIREELIPHINSFPDGPNGQVFLFYCDLQQQINVLNSCTVNKNLVKSSFTISDGKTMREQKVTNFYSLNQSKRLSSTKTSEPVLPPFPPYSDLTSKLWKEESFKPGRDHLPLLQLIYEFRQVNPKCSYDDFSKWLNFHFQGLPLFFKDHRKILSKNYDKEVYPKTSLEVKTVWDSYEKLSDPHKLASLSIWETGKFSNKAFDFIFNSDLRIILHQFINIFIKNIMEMWGYSMMNYSNILVEPALQKLLIILKNASAKTWSTIPPEQDSYKKALHLEKTSIINSFRVLEQSLLITHFLESAFGDNESIIERLLTQYTQSIFDTNDLLLQPLEINIDFANKDEILEICKKFKLDVSPEIANQTSINSIGCFNYLNSSIETLLEEASVDSSKPSYPSTRVYASVKPGKQSLIASSILAKDFLNLNMYY